MSDSKPDIRNWLARKLPLVAVLRGIEPEQAVSCGRALFDAGFRIIEVPLNSPQPLESIRRLSETLGDRALIGAGTVTDPMQIVDIAEAGGRIAVSPHFDPTVVAQARQTGLVALPGVFTPSEMFAAVRAGAEVLKLFPAEAAPASVLKALNTVKPPACTLVPSGGVTPDTLGDYLSAGAGGAFLGGALYRPGLDVDTLAQRANNFAQAFSAWQG